MNKKPINRSLLLARAALNKGTKPAIVQKLYGLSDRQIAQLKVPPPAKDRVQTINEIREATKSCRTHFAFFPDYELKESVISTGKKFYSNQPEMLDYLQAKIGGKFIVEDEQYILFVSIDPL